MTSKHVLLALMSIIYSTQTLAAAWDHTYLTPNNGVIVLLFGKDVSCNSVSMDVMRHGRIWHGSPGRGCTAYYKHPAGRGRILGNVCGVTGSWSNDGGWGRLVLDKSLWGCPKDTYLYADLPQGSFPVAKYFTGGGGSSEKYFKVQPSTVSIKSQGPGFWKTEQVILSGYNLSTVSVVSNRELTINVGDEELQLKRDQEVSISPAKREEYTLSKLKMYFYGETAEKGTTQYRLRFNATYI